MPRRDMFHDKPAPGMDVFVTLTNQKGRRRIVAALLNPLGHDVYGSLLDPDADRPYDIAPSTRVDCQTVVGTFTTDTTHVEIWRNGKGNSKEVFVNQDVQPPLSIVSQEKIQLSIALPFGAVRNTD